MVLMLNAVSMFAQKTIDFTTYDVVAKAGDVTIIVKDSDFLANVNFRVPAWYSSKYDIPDFPFIRHSSDIREIEPFPLISMQS